VEEQGPFESVHVLIVISHQIIDQSVNQWTSNGSFLHKNNAHKCTLFVVFAVLQRGERERERDLCPKKKGKQEEITKKWQLETY
jgi:hypothetical protein